MKRTILLLLFLAGISCISGFLMSKASWIGRVGMTFFYKEYNFMKIWWQGAAAVFIFFLLVFLLQSVVSKRLPDIAARLVHLLILAVAAAALYFTYDDFTTDFSHKLLGHRFHYGFYLVWCGWILICLFFIFRRRRSKMIAATDQDKTETGVS